MSLWIFLFSSFHIIILLISSSGNPWFFVSALQQSFYSILYYVLTIHIYSCLSLSFGPLGCWSYKLGWKFVLLVCCLYHWILIVWSKNLTRLFDLFILAEVFILSMLNSSFLFFDRFPICLQNQCFIFLWFHGGHPMCSLENRLFVNKKMHFFKYKLH